MPRKANTISQRAARRSRRPTAGTAAQVTVTVTTCKRLHLFLATLASFLQHCRDRDQVAEWLCVDDNSSAGDRQEMAERFPFFRFVFKDETRAGCASSMNVLLDQVRSRFVLHLEDDWLFTRDFRVADLLPLLADGRYRQVLLCPRPGGVPLGKTGDGFEVEEYLYNPDHPAKPEIYRRYDEIFPARQQAHDAGWWWPGFSRNPGILDIAFFRSRVGRFDERIDARLFDYDYARRAHDAGAAILSVDCGLTHVGAVSAHVLNQRPRWPWEAGSTVGAATQTGIAHGGTERTAWEVGESLFERPIPNVVHFIYLDGEPGFGLCNLLAILSAHVVQKPRSIFLYFDRAPRAVRWWELAKRFVTLVPRQPPRELSELPARQQVDWLRYQVLLEQGGIYLGTDVLTLKPYDPLRTHGCVLGSEPSNNGARGSADREEIASLTGAVVMAAPRHDFLAQCLEAFPRGATEEGIFLRDLAGRHPGLVHIEPVESFVPFERDTDELFREVSQDALDELFRRRLSRSYSIHLWQTAWWKPFLHEIDESYLLTRESLFARFFRGYLNYLR
ncbi:MAG: glycosyltransferase [Candidatus Binatia bacterium]